MHKFPLKEDAYTAKSYGFLVINFQRCFSNKCEFDGNIQMVLAGR